MTQLSSWSPRRRTAAWLVALGLVCALELATHTAGRSGFLASSRPVNSPNDQIPAEGYVTWIGTLPVLQDSIGFLTLGGLFLGERGPEGSGILDRRAAYAYLATLFIPWAGAYRGFLVLNWLFWWGASAAAFWFVRHRWRDIPLAVVTSLLVAGGNGFIFMAGTPMSYCAAYATFLLILSLGEQLDAFAPSPRLSTWFLLGWAGGVASTIYFAHIPLLLFWWVYGARRVPWRCLAAATLVTLAISLAWEISGRTLVGLSFATDNSAAVGDSVGAWLANARRPWQDVLVYFRGGPLAGAAAIRGTLISAFPYPWWLLGAAGFAASRAADRSWALALVMAGLLPAIVILSLIPLPRAAFYMYPAVYVMAARGALVLGRLTRLRWAAVGAAVAVLVFAGNLDLLGSDLLITRFHHSAGAAW
ncbi:MAG TPA: hypothetical protein VFX49_13295 [Chloroflexota bacterium]|nr:hypothetical protein [Chloroflexota bacterium]